MDKVKLSVRGLSYSESYSGAYALLLSEEGGDKQIPIIIGAFEAQSIAIEFEGLKPPRPLTHDLFKQFAEQFSVELTEVNIYKLEEGVFYSNLVFKHNDELITLDSRTSDAVSLALRFKCPIYTTRQIIDKTGITIDAGNEEGDENQEKPEENKPQAKPQKAESFQEYSLKQLDDMLQEAIRDEDYEKASRLRDEINRRDQK